MKKNINKEGVIKCLKTTQQILPLCEICKERKATHEHHTIFDKETNKSDKTSPIINICALCHAELHGISPKVSELRMLTQEYSRVQKTRMNYDNSMRGFSYIEMKVPEFFEQQSKALNDYEKLLSKKIKIFLENGNQRSLDNHQANVSFPIYSWLTNIKGISHLLAGKLIALIDIDKSPMVSSLWSYAGQTPDSKKQKGKKANWNQELKMVCYQISDSFIKQRTPKYREIYDKEKAKQLILMEGNYKEVDNQCDDVSSLKEEEKIGKDMKTLLLLLLSSPPKSLGHADKRARRKAVKEFLKDLFVEWKNIQKKETMCKVITKDGLFPSQDKLNNQEEIIILLKPKEELFPLLTT